MTTGCRVILPQPETQRMEPLRYYLARFRWNTRGRYVFSVLINRPAAFWQLVLPDLSFQAPLFSLRWHTYKLTNCES